ILTNAQCRDELIFEPSMPSSTRPSSIFSYNSSNTDIESSADTFDNAEDELINRPTTFPAQPPPETIQETFLCQQLALAVILLRKLRRFLVLDPSKLFGKSTAQRVCNVIKEGNIDAIFDVDTDKIVVLGPEVLGDLHQVSRACSIRDRIFGDVELLKIMENLRMDCRDSGRVQLLLTTLRYTAAFVYLAFLQTLDCVHHNDHNPALRATHGGGDGIRHLLPPIVPDSFDLGIHTLANLNRGARTPLLQNSTAGVNGPVGVPPPSGGRLKLSLIQAVAKLTRDRVEEYNAKLKVFQAFCDKFEEAVKQFTTGPEREFAQKFVDSFLGSWNQALTDAESAPVPTTYSAIAASTPSTTTPTTAPSSPGKTDHERPLRVDLRVFIRLDGEAPARAHNDYAVRAHMSRKLQVRFGGPWLRLT
ncbi:hypothetical protein FOXB_15853, partial [Fusarium oxysporum f. sp. conglutinans Fo5176]